jgi:hypothetical protein
MDEFDVALDLWLQCQKKIIACLFVFFFFFFFEFDKPYNTNHYDDVTNITWSKWSLKFHFFIYNPRPLPSNHNLMW